MHVHEHFVLNMMSAVSVNLVGHSRALPEMFLAGQTKQGLLEANINYGSILDPCRVEEPQLAMRLAFLSWSSGRSS